MDEKDILTRMADEYEEPEGGDITYLVPECTALVDCRGAKFVEAKQPGSWAEKHPGEAFVPYPQITFLAHIKEATNPAAVGETIGIRLGIPPIGWNGMSDAGVKMARNATWTAIGAIVAPEAKGKEQVAAAKAALKTAGSAADLINGKQAIVKFKTDSYQGKKNSKYNSWWGATPELIDSKVRKAPVVTSEAEDSDTSV